MRSSRDIKYKVIFHFYECLLHCYYITLVVKIAGVISSKSVCWDINITSDDNPLDADC